MAHNGNLTNSDALSHELFETEMRHLNTDSDSEVLLNVFAHELQARGKLHPAPDDMFDAVAAVHRRCRGGYAAVAMLVNLGVVAFRDPFGIRPLVIGQRGEGDAREYMVASESVALDVLGFTLLGDVAPGEAVFIDARRQLHRRQCAAKPELRPCIFEHVYFARPDSLHRRDLRLQDPQAPGQALADKIRASGRSTTSTWSSRCRTPAARRASQLAHALGIKYREGFIKNRYIGRTFIMPGSSSGGSPCVRS
jgi:amidophosphoribosyltransferase